MPKISCLKALLEFDAQIQRAWQASQRSVTGQNSSLPPFRAVVGLDEVGRGSAIGPVVAAAVSLPEKLSASQKRELHWLNDSKQLTPAIRAEVAGAIRSFCRWGIGKASKDEVDSLNVHYASLLAIERAYAAWRAFGEDVLPDSHEDLLLIDGRALMPDRPQRCQQAVVKGDGKSASIAAASVVAKEHRDTMIIALAKNFPGYGWETNIGYQTPEHREAIARLGLTPHHRKNFKITQQQLTLSLS